MSRVARTDPGGNRTDPGTATGTDTGTYPRRNRTEMNMMPERPSGQSTKRKRPSLPPSQPLVFQQRLMPDTNYPRKRRRIRNSIDIMASQICGSDGPIIAKVVKLMTPEIYNLIDMTAREIISALNRMTVPVFMNFLTILDNTSSKYPREREFYMGLVVEELLTN